MRFTRCKITTICIGYAFSVAHSALAQVSPDIHKLCIEAKDYAGCVQALPGAEVNLSVEIHVKVPDGIDDATARIVLENSRSLKADNPQIY